jgi:tRNA (guanine37-N1)-methyltransferase
MKFTVVTLFPEMLAAITDYGITSRAVKQQLLAVDTVNPRDFTRDKHRTVDDRPYGGGPGMVMMIEPMRQAIQASKKALEEKTGQVPKVIYVSPQGAVFNQQKAKALAELPAAVIVAGRYEGLDQRLIDQEIDEEISLGDFVVSGGELPAMMMIDAVARCLPGVLGHEDSATEDSFFQGLLDHPHFTRPEVDELTGTEVASVLLGGNHEAIRRWRLKQSLGQTWLKRPDLLEQRDLTEQEQQLLQEFQQEYRNIAKLSE